jgi:diguanylate cyclase (GGDEF)-like protein/PAS domain S-box-containing protein
VPETSPRGQEKAVQTLWTAHDLDVRFQAVARSITDAIVSADSGASIVFWNPAAERTFGYTEAEALGRPLTMLMPERFREACHEGLTRNSATGESRVIGRTVELVGCRKDGTEFPLELTLATWELNGTRFYTGIIRDITLRELSERQLLSQEAFVGFLQTVAVAANAAGGIDDALQIAVDGICRQMGWPVGHVYLSSEPSRDLLSADIWHLDPPERFVELKRQTEETRLGPGEGLPGMVASRRKPVWMQDAPEHPNFLRAHGKLLGIRAGFAFPVVIDEHVAVVLEFFSEEPLEPDHILLGIAEHIGGELARVIQHKQREEELQTTRHQLEHLAFHDPLTGLANRPLFEDRLKHALARRTRTNRPVAVLFMDLDDFKLINDGFGHAAGDEVLTEIARRLERAIRPTDTAARFGGDEFAVLLEDVTVDGGAVAVAARVTEAVATPIRLETDDVTMHASVGLATATGDGSSRRLVQDADVAMYVAKSKGKGHFEVYHPSMRAASADQKA